MAKTQRAVRRFNRVLQNRTQKCYLAQVEGHFPEDELIVDQPILVASNKDGGCRIDTSGKSAQTKFKFKSYNPRTNRSIVWCWPLTGRTHQIRVHCQHLGHPIANDPLYSAAYRLKYEEKEKQREEKERKEKEKEKEGEEKEKDENRCEECGEDMGYRNLDEEAMCIWLHAYSLTSDLWEFHTEMPRWCE